MHKLFLTIFLLILSFITHTTLHAQLGASASDVVITTNPPNPRANQEVVISLTSSALNLDTASISWYLGGKLLKQGIGTKSTIITTSSIGSTSVIEVVIRGNEGSVVRKVLYLRPAEVDILWEANTYTPPFYQGKALYTHQASVRFVALPNFTTSSGVKIDPSTLLYIWKLDGKVLNAESGRGKSFITVKGSMIPKPLSIRVEVENTEGTLSAASSFELEALNPGILVYEDNPIYGILYNKAFGSSFELHNKEIKVIALPMFFSGKSRNASHLSYSWSVNNETTTQDSLNPSTITLRHEGESAGASDITVSVENTRDILQRVVRTFSAAFNGSQSI